MKNNILKDFSRYVSLNILGMIGLSCYILADTFFVSKALGSNGITALNFSISIYSLINGVGLMIGIGGAGKFAILKSKKDNKTNKVFSNSINIGVIVGLAFLLIGILFTENLAKLLGADSVILPLTKAYLQTLLSFAPFFILNNVVLAFVRNDNNPNLSMIAMLIGSFSNIILDYVFMFPLGMGMFGAAFATGLAPIISLLILSLHFIKKKTSIRYEKSKIEKVYLYDICKIGLSSFITEVSSSVALITFNLIILNIEGNIGVASYGIVANIALIGMSIFTGLAQGIQPLISKGHGNKNKKMLKQVLKYALVTSISLALLIYVVIFTNSEGIVSIFNSEGIKEISLIAKEGLIIYFLGFLFAGINIVISMYLSAREKGREAFIISILRGCLIIVPLVIVFSRLFDMRGVWLSFVTTELLVMIISLVFTFSNKSLVKEEKSILKAS